MTRARGRGVGLGGARELAQGFGKSWDFLSLRRVGGGHGYKSHGLRFVGLRIYVNAIIHMAFSVCGAGVRV